MAVQGLGMLRAEQAATEFEGPLEVRLALRIKAEHPVRVADRLADRGLDLGLARELAVDVAAAFFSSASTVTCLSRAFFSGAASASRSFEGIRSRPWRRPPRSGPSWRNPWPDLRPSATGLAPGGWSLRPRPRLRSARVARPPARCSNPHPGGELMPRIRTPSPAAPGFSRRSNFPMRSVDAKGWRRPTIWFRVVSVHQRARRRGNPVAVSYRRLRSFSSARITIQSSSPLTSLVNRAGSVLALRSNGVRVSRDSLEPGAGRRRLLLLDPRRISA